MDSPALSLISVSLVFPLSLISALSRSILDRERDFPHPRFAEVDAARAGEVTVITREAVAVGIEDVATVHLDPDRHVVPRKPEAIADECVREERRLREVVATRAARAGRAGVGLAERPGLVAQPEADVEAL